MDEFTQFISIDLQVTTGKGWSPRFQAVARFCGGYLRDKSAVSTGATGPVASQRAVRELLEAHRKELFPTLLKEDT